MIAKTRTTREALAGPHCLRYRPASRELHIRSTGRGPAVTLALDDLARNPDALDLLQAAIDDARRGSSAAPHAPGSLGGMPPAGRFEATTMHERDVLGPGCGKTTRAAPRVMMC